jgi:hypothetical protein
VGVCALGWLLYYWHFFKTFGAEVWRTAIWGLLTSFLGAFIHYLVAAKRDSGALVNLREGLLTSALIFGVFALWHLAKTPWLIHSRTTKQEQPTERWAAGLGGIAVLISMLVGAYYLTVPLWVPRKHRYALSMQDPQYPGFSSPRELTFMNDMGNVFSVRRKYELPPGSPDGLIWLQIGRGYPWRKDSGEAGTSK